MAAAPHVGSEAEVLERHGGPAKAGRLTVQIVSPRGPVASGPADDITAPGLVGEFGVLPGHVPFLAALKPGVMSWKEGGQVHVLAVDRGYLEVGAGDRIIALVERAEKPEDVDVETARAEVAKQSDALKAGGLDTAGIELARAALGWAQAQLDAHEKVAGKAAAQKH
jgi:F-type H+-transporting ATPase subunit epsilon